MAEMAQLIKLSEILESGDYERAEKVIIRMLDMTFSDIHNLYSLLSRYPKLNTSPYIVQSSSKYLPGVADNEIISNDLYYPFMSITLFNEFNLWYFVGYHTAVVGNFLYDFKVNRSYFIVAKYCCDGTKLGIIAVSNKLFDELYDYCHVIKPSYHLSMNIEHTGDNIITIALSYKTDHIMTILYNCKSNKISAAKTSAERTHEPPKGDYPYELHTFYKIEYTYWDCAHNKLRRKINLSECEKIIQINFGRLVIKSAFIADYSMLIGANYCNSIVERI